MVRRRTRDYEPYRLEPTVCNSNFVASFYASVKDVGNTRNLKVEDSECRAVGVRGNEALHDPTNSSYRLYIKVVLMLILLVSFASVASFDNYF